MTDHKWPYNENLFAPQSWVPGLWPPARAVEAEQR